MALDRPRPARTKTRADAAPLLSLHLRGGGGAVVLPSHEGLIRGLAECLFGWEATLSPDLPEEAGTLAVIATEGAGRYRFGSRYLDQPMGALSVTSTVCAVIADLALGYCDALPGGIGLHCGALTVGGGPLIVLAGPHRAGKSTLVAHMSQRPDCQVFCDDVLPVTATGQAVALGFAPRIRLPALSVLADAPVVLADDRYAYVRPHSPVSHGTQARPQVLVALDRVPGSGAPRLHRIGADAAINLILRQTLTALSSPSAALQQAHALASTMTCITLRYDDPSSAADLLAGRFGDRPGVPDLPFAPPVPHLNETKAAPAPAHQRLRRAPGVQVRRHGDGLFLWHLASPMLWHLNPLGQTIWALLDLPQTPARLGQVLADAFDTVPPEQIAADVATFLGAAMQADLVQPV